MSHTHKQEPNTRKGMLHIMRSNFFASVGRLVGVKEVSPQIKAGYGEGKRKSRSQRRVYFDGCEG